MEEPGASLGIICPQCTQKTHSTIDQYIVPAMTSFLAAVGKKGNVFFLNEIASRICSSCLQFAVWGAVCRSRQSECVEGVGVPCLLKRIVECLDDVCGPLPPSRLPTYDGCVSVTGGAPRCLGTATTGRGGQPGLHSTCSNLLFMLVAGRRRAGPSPSFLAVTAPARPVRDQVTADTNCYSRWRTLRQRAQR